MKIKNLKATDVTLSTKNHNYAIVEGVLEGHQWFMPVLLNEAKSVKPNMRLQMEAAELMSQGKEVEATIAINLANLAAFKKCMTDDQMEALYKITDALENHPLFQSSDMWGLETLSAVASDYVNENNETLQRAYLHKLEQLEAEDVKKAKKAKANSKKEYIAKKASEEN